MYSVPQRRLALKLQACPQTASRPEYLASPGLYSAGMPCSNQSADGGGAPSLEGGTRAPSSNPGPGPTREPPKWRATTAATMRSRIRCLSDAGHSQTTASEIDPSCDDPRPGSGTIKCNRPRQVPVDLEPTQLRPLPPELPELCSFGLVIRRGANVHHPCRILRIHLRKQASQLPVVAIPCSPGCPRATLTMAMQEAIGTKAPRGLPTWTTICIGGQDELPAIPSSSITGGLRGRTRT